MQHVAASELSNEQPPGSPAIEWLANGRYAVLVTAAGGGFSALEDHLLTVWCADSVESESGFIIYVRDLETGRYSTASGRPVPGQSGGRIVRDATGLRIVRVQQDLVSEVDVRLHDSAGVEQRTCTLINTSSVPRRVEITSFVEVALNHPAAHASHPAFSKLFVQTAPCGDGPVLAATRRPRQHGEIWPVLMHALLDAPVTDFATDRARFIGRGRCLSRPRALTEAAELGRTHGNVLDPALSLRTVVHLEPGASCSVRFVLAAGENPRILLEQLEGLRHSSLDELAVPTTSEPGNRSRTRADSQTEFLLDLARGLLPFTPLRSQAAECRTPVLADPSAERTRDLRFFNGYGGFSPDGREYVIRIASSARSEPELPPAPWTNVIANPGFGCLVSEKGAGTVWSQNSRKYRLTPWSNDPVVDPHGDAVYVRDEESGLFWSPTPGPAATSASSEVRHGFGYSTWHHRVGELVHDLTVFVPESEPLRVTRLRIHNGGTRRRRLAVYAYTRWVLGATAEATRSTIRTEFSEPLQAVLARNLSAPEGLRRIAFIASDQAPLDGWCADRAAFLGTPGSTAAPAALQSDGKLSGEGGADPCGVVRVILDIAPGMTGEVAFLLGDAPTESEIVNLLAAFRGPGRIESALQRARDVWKRMLSRLQVETPSMALNFMVNGWLPYQDIACRLWARSAFYQSGGAFGFRDQVQDAAAIIHLRPDLTRAQILLHAGHQFVEGDVLHWWHPPDDRGLRTRFADDLLWLPWVTAYYIGVTGDRAILTEEVPYLESRQLHEGEAEAFIRPNPSNQRGDVYEHCCRAIDRSLKRGVHGLPLFGTGDWNDGMNRVGHEGRGESVWMGFFLVTVLRDFLPVCDLRGDAGRAARYRRHSEELCSALNGDGWDGAWYRRGWYDSGAVLGSRSSDECRIDALVQAWAVISKAAPAERVEVVLDSLEEHLIDDRAQLIRLFTPPFVDTPNDPGYIKGYVAGVRENGGQYTHAATWVVKAMAEAGRRDRAMELLEALIPINHSLDRAAAEKYKVEPYVVAADVYGAEPHIGRGGWTWYTGSAGWMYRVAVETFLGFSIEGGDTLCLRPRIPDAWPEVQMDYQFDERTRIHIDVRNPEGCARRVVGAELDGERLELHDGAARVPLVNTGRGHWLRIVMGR